MGDMPIIRTGHCGPHGTFFGAACPLCAMAISGVDPRDARIAELEAALAGLAVAAVDAASFDVCHEDQCPRLSTWWRVAVGNAAWESCDEHIESFRAEDAKAESKGCRKREGWREREEADEVRAFGAAIEVAERALGRRE